MADSPDRSHIPNYQFVGEEADENCGNCGAFEDGYCHMYDVQVEANHWCSEWVARGEYKHARRVAQRYLKGLSETTQDVLSWLRKHGGEADLRTLMDAGYSENRLKKVTQELKDTDVAEVKRRGLQPTVLQLKDT